jgi:hypothetical protein
MLKERFAEIFRINATPGKIAAGFAVGAFIGVFPTFGLGGVLAIFLAWLFRLNYASTVLGAVIVMNPVTAPFFWGLSAAAGAAMFAADSREILQQIKNGIIVGSIREFTLIYLAGNLIISSVVSLISYFAVKGVVTAYRKNRSKSDENR